MAVTTPAKNLESEGTFWMQSSHSLDGLDVTFDDANAVAGAGLILAATLSQHLGLRQLFDDHVDLGDAPGPTSAASSRKPR